MSAPESDVALVARQPIFDSGLNVVAYELLYRDDFGAGAMAGTDPVAATSSVLVNLLLELGVERLSGGLPIHVNFPAGMLCDPACLMLPPERLVVEVLEDTRGTPAVLDSLARLRRRGYRIALDDYVPGQVDENLLDCADFVKLDLAHLPGAQLAPLAGRLRARGLTCIAEKVETREQFECCSAAGIGLHQGYFLQRPETFRGRPAAVNLASTLRLLFRLQDTEWHPAAIEKLIATDAALAWRVLRAVQSAGVYLPRRIESLAQAAIVLGRDHLLRLVALLLMSRCRDRPLELIRNALLRARIAELLAISAARSQSSGYFVAGLLTLVPAIVGISEDQAFEGLPLHVDIEQGVLHGQGPIGEALSCTRALERGEWPQVRFAALSTEAIRQVYLDACQWLHEFAGLLAEH